MTKISARGKKQKKNWTAVWSELTPEQLTFYKQQTGSSQVAALCLCALMSPGVLRCPLTSVMFLSGRRLSQPPLLFFLFTRHP